MMNRKYTTKEKEAIFVKPSIDTGEGEGVDIVDPADEETLLRVIGGHLSNAGFVVERFFKQHTLMAKTNPSSLNTMRLFTYRRSNGDIVPILKQNFMRIGGRGAWKDNITTGGGFCHMESDGMLSNRVYTGLFTGSRRFIDVFGTQPYKLPFYSAAVDFVLDLHSRLRYFDTIGWDIAIDELGRPALIEYNVGANLRSAQIVGGPMYGEYIDEVMDRVSCVQHRTIACQVNVFKYGYDRFIQTAGPETDVL